MRTKTEVIELLKDRIKNGYADPKIEDIILEDGGRLLVRIMSAMKIENNTYLSTRYEIWHDEAKYRAGIPGEDGKIYCRGYAGGSDEEMISKFRLSI